MVYLADLNLEVIYFLQLCQFFVGPTQCQFTNNSDFLLQTNFIAPLPKKMIFDIKIDFKNSDF